MKVHLAGHLNWYDEHRRTWFEVKIAEVTRVEDLVARLGIPRGEVAVVVINSRPAELADALAGPDDVVELFPPIGGG